MPSAPLRSCPLCSLSTPEKICPHDGTPTYIKVVETPGLAAGLVIGDRYRIISRIGQGGFGAVYKAVHVATRNDIAIKVLKRELAADASQVQRFHAEAQASSLLQQAHTVRVYDFGQIDDGSLYLAMEFLRGRPLEALLHDTPALPPKRAVHILGQVLASLSEAHEHGIVHRDLKPDNIFVVDMHGETDWVKVIDFGIAKFTGEMEQSLTRSGMAIGTPRYMSPEQARAGKVDGRSDLYSLGIIAYRLLTGTLPFDGANSVEIVVAQISAPPRPIADVTPQPLPPALVEAVERALAKNPDDRFQTADEMRAALESSLADPRTIGPAASTVSPYRGGTVSAYSRAVSAGEGSSLRAKSGAFEPRGGTLLTPASKPSIPALALATPPRATSRPRMQVGGSGSVAVEPKGGTLLTPASKPSIPVVGPATPPREPSGPRMQVGGSAVELAPGPKPGRVTAVVALVTLVAIAVLGAAFFIVRATVFRWHPQPAPPLAATPAAFPRALAAPPPPSPAPVPAGGAEEPQRLAKPVDQSVDALAPTAAPTTSQVRSENSSRGAHHQPGRRQVKAVRTHQEATERPKRPEAKQAPQKGPSNDFQPFN